MNLLVNRLARFMPGRVQDRLMRLKLETGHGRSLVTVPEPELEDAYRRALRWLRDRQGPDAVGDYLEFGVYVGTSMGCMQRALAAEGLHHVRSFGFDSFEGLPERARYEDAGRWRPGDYRSSLELARDLLSRKGVDWDRVFLVKGWFDDTLTDELIARYGIRKASVIMVDCDIYSSARTALAFAMPLIRDEAIIFFDDWDAHGLAADGLGEGKAFEEILAAHPELTAEPWGGPQSYRSTARSFLVSCRAAAPGGLPAGSREDAAMLPVSAGRGQPAGV